MRKTIWFALTAAWMSMPLTAVGAVRCDLIFGRPGASPHIADLAGRFVAKARGLEAHISNESGFLKKLELLEKAKDGGAVDLAYFIYENDFSSSYFSQQLMAIAARKNLKVRLLVDYVMAEKFKDTMAALDAHPNIEVRLFRPPTAKLVSLLRDGLKLPRPDLFLEGIGTFSQSKILEALTASPFVMKKLTATKALIAELKAAGPAASVDPSLLIQRVLKDVELADVALGLALRTEFTTFTKRLHHKLMSVETVDGVEYINGGRNISDEYNLSLGHPFLRDRSYPFFDAEVSGRLSGDPAAEMKNSYEELWASPLSVPVPKATPEVLARENAAMAEKAAAFLAALPDIQAKVKDGRLELGTREIVYSENGPASARAAKDISSAWETMIGKAKRKVTIVSAYFYFTPEMRAAVKEAAARGVQVEIYTNSFTSTDMNMVNLGVYRVIDQWKAELGPNVRFFELNKGPKEGSLHAKLIVVDDAVVGIGSANTDPRTDLHDSNNMTTIDLSSEPGAVARILAAYAAPEGLLKLTWTELAAERAKGILQQAAQKYKRLLELFSIPDIVNQL